MKSFFNRKADTSTAQSKPPPSAPSASYKFWASSSKQPGSSSAQALKRDKVDATGYAQPNAATPYTRAPAQAANSVEPDGIRAQTSNNPGYSTESSRPHYSRKPSSSNNPYIASSSRPTPSILSPLPHQSSFAYGSKDLPSQDAYRSDPGYTTEPADRSREKYRDRERRHKDREKSTTRQEEPELRRERRHLKESSTPTITERDDRRRTEQKEQDGRRQGDDDAKDRRREEDRRNRREGRERIRYESADANAHDYRATERTSDMEEAQKMEALRIKAKTEREEARNIRRARRASEAAEESSRKTRETAMAHKPGSSQDYYLTSRTEPPVTRPNPSSDRNDFRQKNNEDRVRPSNAELLRSHRLPRQGYEEQDISDSQKPKVVPPQPQRQRNSVSLPATAALSAQPTPDPYATIPARTPKPAISKTSEPTASGARTGHRSTQDAAPRSRSKARTTSTAQNVFVSPRDKAQMPLPISNVMNLDRGQTRPEMNRPLANAFPSASAAAATPRDTSLNPRPLERTRQESSAVPLSRMQPSNEQRPAGSGVANTFYDPYPSSKATHLSSSMHPNTNLASGQNSRPGPQQSNPPQSEPANIRQNNSQTYANTGKAQAQISSYQPQIMSSASASAARAAQREQDSTRLQPPANSRYGGFPVAKVPSSSSAQSHESESRRGQHQPQRPHESGIHDDRKAAVSQKQPRLVPPPMKSLQRTAEPTSEMAPKHSPPIVLRRADQAAEKADEDEEVILPVPVPRSLGLQPLYGPPEDEVRAEAVQAKQREAGYVNRSVTALANGWDSSNGKMGSFRDREQPYPQQPESSQDKKVMGPFIQRPAASMTPLTNRNDASSRQIVDARDVSSRKREVTFNTTPYPSERVTHATKPLATNGMATATQEASAVLSPHRHQRQLSEPIIRDSEVTSYMPSGLAMDSGERPSKRPIAAQTETNPRVNQPVSSSRYPQPSPEINKSDERPSPKGSFGERQETEQGVSHQLRTNALDSSMTTRTPMNGDKKKPSKHARSRSAQDANGRADMSQNYLSMETNGRAVKQPSHSSESPASKRSDGLTSTPENKVGNPPGFTPPFTGLKPMHQPSPVLNGVVDIVKHPRLEELLSDPVPALQENNAGHSRGDASNANKSLPSNQFSSASAYAKRRSPVNSSSRLKPSPVRADYQTLPTSSIAAHPSQASASSNLASYANTSRDPSTYGNRPSPDIIPDGKGSGLMSFASPKVTDSMPPSQDLANYWEDRAAMTAPTMPARFMNASSGSTSQHKPTEATMPPARQDIIEPKSPSIHSRPSHESNASIFNGFSSSAATHANHALHGAAAAQQAIANSSRRPSPAAATTASLQLDISGETVPISRAPSQDSVILKTPSSLARSMMPLKPTMSRASQQASGDEGRKKGGLLSMFRSSSKAAPNPSSSQHQLWRPPTREQDSASTKDRREGPAKLKKAAPIIPDDDDDDDDDDSEERPSPPKWKRAPPPPLQIAVFPSPERERKSPHGGGVFTPFRYLTSKRHRTVSGASVDVNDGFSTVANTLGSPTASMHSSTPVQPPPLRDPRMATQEWRENGHHVNGPVKIKRPGVVFDVEQEMFEDKQSVKNFKPRSSSSSRPSRKLTRS